MCLFCGSFGPAAAAVSREVDMNCGEFMVAIGIGQIRDGERRPRKAEIERTSLSTTNGRDIGFSFLNIVDDDGASPRSPVCAMPAYKR